MGRDEFLEVGMQIKLLDCRGEGGEQPDGEPDAAGGLQDVDADAHAVEVTGAVEGLLLQEARPLLFAGHLPRHLQQQIPRDGFAGGAQCAANPQRGGVWWFGGLWVAGVPPPAPGGRRPAPLPGANRWLRSWPPN